MTLKTRVRSDQAGGFMPGRIVADDSDQGGASPETSDIARHIAHAAQHHLFGDAQQDGNRRLRRDAGHIAVNVSIHHQVAHADDPCAMYGGQKRM